MAMPVAIRHQADAHQLVAVKLLFAAQAADGLLIGIGRNTTGKVDGWFHGFLKGITEGAIPRSYCDKVYHAFVSRRLCRSRNAITPVLS